MRSDSVCWDCKHCINEEAFPGGPDLTECEECSSQFMMGEGCYSYEERKDENDL